MISPQLHKKHKDKSKVTHRLFGEQDSRELMSAPRTSSLENLELKCKPNKSSKSLVTITI